MCSQRVKLASGSAGKSSVGAEMIVGARKRRAHRSGSSGMANSERIHLDVLRPTRKSWIVVFENYCPQNATSGPYRRQT